MKKLVSLALAAVLLVTMSFMQTASAVGKEKSKTTVAQTVSGSISPQMTYINYCLVGFDVSLLSADVAGTIQAYSGVTSVKIKLELQKLSSGVYSTVKTWEETTPGTFGNLEGSAVISPFSTYRLKATFTAYAGSNSETAVYYEYE